MITYAVYLLIVALLVLADQLSKKAVVANITLNDKIPVIKGFFNLTYVKNFGAGFSILQNARLFLIAISTVAVIALAVLIYRTKKNDFVSLVSYLLILSGALGNLIDRAVNGYVVDFLHFIIFGYDYPVFNIADSFITIGCFILIIQAFTENRRAKNKTAG